MSFDQDLLCRIVEGALLASGETLTVKRLASLFESDEAGSLPAPKNDEIQKALEQIQEKTQDRGFALVEVASGWRFQVKDDLSPWVNRLWDEKPQKYSRALLETIAIIAYRQPLTRGDIEEVRGVAVSSHIVKTLAEREWIKVVGQRDVPGRPSLYATTKQFLDYFGLKKLDELPTLKELQDIDSLNNTLELGEPDITPVTEEDLEQEQIAEAVALESAVDEKLEENLQDEIENDVEPEGSAPSDAAGLEPAAVDSTGQMAQPEAESSDDGALTVDTESSSLISMVEDPDSLFGEKQVAEIMSNTNETELAKVDAGMPGLLEEAVDDIAGGVEGDSSPEDKLNKNKGLSGEVDVDSSLEEDEA